MNTNARDKNIQESLYLVSFIKLSAIEAAIICRMIEITRAISRIMTSAIFTKVGVIY
jgi:hypothetical protein